MLVTAKEILGLACKEGYAVGAFNCVNLEQLLAIVEAAELEKAPVIIQTSESALKYAGRELLGQMIKCAAKQSFVPIALHLDHGQTYETIEWCVKNGWTSVMIDASSLPLKENIKRTQKVVSLAKAQGVSVEAELGRISGVEDQVEVFSQDAFFTDPQEAREFAKETKIDALAVAIGTVHGNYVGALNLDFERLKQIKQLVPLPLVLHGGSGLTSDDITKAIKLGINKINIDTELRLAFAQGCREVLTRDPDEHDPRKICGCARDKVREVVQKKIRIFAVGNRLIKV